ncbi:MAG: YqgE/AlgH family protein [Gammaproteobacteria bacterium]|jgi:putative transcriptional regulator|nr:YqgE/AlgH family protein [Gammaproteobacteria bacterium]
MQNANLTSHFVIAMPSLMDANFNQTVTYICEHNEDGAFGVVINRKSDITFDDIIFHMDIAPHTRHTPHENIYHGGPMQQDRGFILHQSTGKWASSLKINEQLTLTTSRDVLEAIACNEGPEQAIITLGYAGWASGQQEQDMANNAWLSCPADEQIIFEVPAEQRWQAAADLLGIDLQLLSHEAGHA